VWRTFPTLSAARLWRQDAQVALRRGTMRPPTAKTIAEAAEVLIKGAHDGTILDRGGKPYKPSTARGYEQLLHAYVVPALGAWKLSQIQRRDVQDFVDDLRKQGLSPSTIANILDPLRSSSAGRSAATRSPSTRPRTSTCRPSAAAATGSSRPNGHMNTSPPSRTQSGLSGRSPCSAGSGAASSAASSGPTTTSTTA
jgi:hypothetical protein